MILIGITGTHGAGKGEVTEYLVSEKGFAHGSARSFFAEEMHKRGIEVTRENMTNFANELRATHPPGYTFRQMLARAKATDKPGAVIESLRTLAEIEELRKHENAHLLAVDADPQIRYERLHGRQSEFDNLTFEEFRAEEEREMHNIDPHKQNIGGVMQLADYTIYNNGTREELHAQVDEILHKVGFV